MVPVAPPSGDPVPFVPTIMTITKNLVLEVILLAVWVWEGAVVVEKEGSSLKHEKLPIPLPTFLCNRSRPILQ